MKGKIFAVIKREYLIRVKTKGFIIGTLIIPVVIGFLLGGVFLFRSAFKPSTRTYAVMDQTGKMFDKFVAMLPDTLKTGERKFQFILKEIPPQGLDEALQEVQKQVVDKEIDGYMVIPEDVVDSREVRYAARSVANYEEQRRIANSLSFIVSNERLERLDLPVPEIRNALRRVRLVSRQVTEDGELDKSSSSSFVLTYILSYILLMLIMAYGQVLMRSVIEEKSQFITETIISSIKPVQLMIGKLIGVCAVGATQLLILGLFIMALATYGEPLMVRLGIDMPEILEVLRRVHLSPTVLFFMIVFFLLGFAFFASMFAAVGAMVNTEDEGQQFQLPLIFMVLIGYFAMFGVIQSPETPTALWVSLIPLFTPMVMFARIVVTDPVLPSGAIPSLFIMAASVAGIIWLTAKIYRVGILMYGKKPSIKEAIKWVRYK
jgi:ABC-2 type transport system permease protein